MRITFIFQGLPVSNLLGQNFDSFVITGYVLLIQLNFDLNHQLIDEVFSLNKMQIIDLNQPCVGTLQGVFSFNEPQ